MNQSGYHIPANFTDAGRLFGLFEVRNGVEAAVLCAPAAGLCILLARVLPVSVTMKVVLSLFLLVPAGGFALIGIRDDSLTRFLRIYLHWRRSRRILLYRGEPMK